MMNRCHQHLGLHCVRLRLLYSNSKWKSNKGENIQQALCKLELKINRIQRELGLARRLVRYRVRPLQSFVYSARESTRQLLWTGKRL